jgi:opacity protein-like surface antigen
MTIDGNDHRRGHLYAVVFSLCALLSAGSQAAFAADWIDDVPLRGAFSGGPMRWDGVNFGVHAGVSVMNTAFGGSTSSQVAYLLRNTTIENEFAPSGWATLPSTDTNSASYGAFLGYSVQWDALVLGVDAAYSRNSSLEAAATDSISRQFVTSDGFNNNVTVTATASVKLVDYATLRGRAGYAIGQFLPYAFFGGVVGRFNYVSTAHVQADGTPPAGGPGAPFSLDLTSSDGKDNAFAAGVTAGVGLDVAIMPNVFLRGEWEYIYFAPLHGINTYMNTLRAGIGLRF